MGALQVRGANTLAKKNEEVYVKGSNTKTAVQTLAIGTKDVSAFIGVGDYFNTPTEAVGFAVTDLDLAAVLMTPTNLNGDLVQYFAVNANLQSAGLVGMGDVLTAKISKFNLEANVSILNGSLSDGLDNVIDFSRSGENDTAYKVKTGSEDNFISLDYDSFLTKTSGHMKLGAYGMFEIDTFFDMEITTDSFGLFIGEGIASIGTEDTHKIAGVNVEGIIAINKDGLATNLKVNSGLDLGDAFALENDFKLVMNTMGKDYVYTVPQKFVDDLGYNSITVSATSTNGESAVDT